MELPVTVWLCDLSENIGDMKDVSVLTTSPEGCYFYQNGKCRSWQLEGQDCNARKAKIVWDEEAELR